MVQRSSAAVVIACTAVSSARGRQGVPIASLLAILRLCLAAEGAVVVKAFRGHAATRNSIGREWCRVLWH